MRKLYLYAGLAGVLVFLLAQIPAPLLYHWSRDDLDPQIHVFGVRGTLWSGEASSVHLSGIRLQDVKWQLRPLSLLFLRLSHRVSAQTDGGDIRAKVSKTLLGTIRISDLSGGLPVEQLGPTLQLPLFPITGRMSLELDKLTLRNGKPLRADGAILFKDLVFSFTSPPAALGNYRGQLSTQQGMIKLDILSEGGDLEAKGFAELGTEEGKYQLDVKLRARATASAGLSSLLQSMGRPDAEGWYPLRHAGAI